MQHACGDFQQNRPIRQLRPKMRKSGLPDMSTFDPVDRRRLRRFHAAQNSAPSGPNPILGPVLKKRFFPVENQGGIHCVPWRWGKAR
jgi:hypothetical protein